MSACKPCTSMSGTVGQYEHHLRVALRKLEKLPGSKYWIDKATDAKEQADLWRRRLTDHIKTHEGGM